jgi:hypothetical protein
VLLNPSTASAESDDPTVRKCVGFSRRLGAGSIEIGNLFAFRATDPKDLKAALLRGRDCVGLPHANNALRDIAARADTFVVGWGANASHKLLRPRVNEVLALLRGLDVLCLGVGADGQPNHPLMLSYDTPLVPFTGGSR